MILLFSTISSFNIKQSVQLFQDINTFQNNSVSSSKYLFISLENKIIKLTFTVGWLQTTKIFSHLNPEIYLKKVSIERRSNVYLCYFLSQITEIFLYFLEAKMFQSKFKYVSNEYMILLVMKTINKCFLFILEWNECQHWSSHRNSH